MERKKWHEYCMKVYNFHPFFTDAIRGNDKEEIKRVNFLTGLFGGQSKGTLCDVGSQEGFISNQLAMMGFDVTAVDSCKRFIEEGKLRYPLVKFKEGFFEDMGLEQVFDYIICTETLEHVCNPDAFLEAIVKSLKAGGTAVLSVPIPECGEYLTHFRTWGKKEFPRFIGQRLTIEDSFIHGKWNYVIATKGVAMEIGMEDLAEIMGGVMA